MLSVASTARPPCCNQQQEWEPAARAGTPRPAATLSSCPHASRLFQPVQYGQKPEGRTVAFPSTHPPRTATSTAATATPQGHVRGRPPIATFSANPDAKGMSCVVVCLPQRVLPGPSDEGPPFCRRDLCSPRTSWRLFYVFKLDFTRRCTLRGGVCGVVMRMLRGGAPGGDSALRLPRR